MSIAGVHYRMNLKNNQRHGFTLIECIITLLIVGILAFIAFPSYRAHVTKVHRAEAYALLLSAASELEAFYRVMHTYEGATLTKSNSKCYKITVETERHAYLIQAIPQASQASQDLECGTLSLNDLGERKITGTGEVSRCWGG